MKNVIAETVGLWRIFGISVGVVMSVYKFSGHKYRNCSILANIIKQSIILTSKSKKTPHLGNVY